ncbi:MAG: GGDEF domain-containing protein [Lachnospiraceae bacterium]|nr:GGDEF domain-containing protein [Lachnospiraceae bacterium]
MTQKKHSLNISIIKVCTIFITLLTITLSIATYKIYSDTIIKKYQSQMESIVSYIESSIDTDDMSRCAETYTESKKYKEARILFDRFVDNYSDIHYLYILKPVFPEDPVKVRSILSANSTYEKENEPENVLYLGDGDADWFTDDIAQQYKEIMQGDEDVYFIQKTEWGTDYTLARPLINSKGEHFALLCVDIAIDDIKSTIAVNVFSTIVLIIAMGFILVLLLILWLRYTITLPISHLEASVLRLANSSSGKRNPEDLLFVAPKIRANNEIKSLSNSIEKLYSDMKDYVKAVATVENEAKGLQAHMSEINTIAYQDPLTKLKNKAAYAKKSDELMWGMIDKQVSFGIVMIDVNFLKKVNDTYGHDKGDMYIKGACEIMSDVYAHSPIFRIGGDEFVVILEGRDYENRDELLKLIRQRYKESASSDRDPWLKYSAAVGMALYHPGSDLDVDTVFKRADNDMYHEKIKMKGLRTQ